LDSTIHIARERKKPCLHVWRLPVCNAIETGTIERMLNRGNRIMFLKRVTSHGLGESLDYKHQERRHGEKSVVVSRLLS
jgi:hypothetical protein